MAAQNQNSPGSSGEFYVILVLVLICIFMIVVNKQFIYVATAWKFLRTIEICSVSWVPDWTPFLGSLNLERACHFLIDTPAEQISKSIVHDFDHKFSRYFSWIPALVLLSIGFIGIKRNAEVSQTFNTETMLKYFEKWYPDILSEVAKDNPNQHPLEYDRDLPETGKYGKSMSPEAFGVLSPPLGLEAEAKTDSSFNSPIWDGESEFDEDLAERAFAKQLGERYQGRLEFNPVQKRVLSIVHSKVPTSEKDRFVFLKDGLKSLIDEYEGKPEEKYNIVLYPIFPSIKTHIIDTISKTKKSKKGLSKDELLALLKECLADRRKFTALDDKKNKAYLSNCAMFKIERKLAQHAYVNTGMMSLLVEAREAGRVDSFANFNWVKEKDRTLWYCLDTVGRNVSFIECAGVFSHWTIEKIVGQPITHPEVTGAVEGLKKYLVQEIEE
ncbi:hypothetical protein ACI2KR_07595 [Pseudomonas luteola]